MSDLDLTKYFVAFPRQYVHKGFDCDHISLLLVDMTHSLSVFSIHLLHAFDVAHVRLIS